MAIRNIIKIGDDILRKKCRRVEKFDDRLVQTIEDMKETLKKANGCGLAAPQIGLLRRFAIVDTSDDASDVIVLINPEITEQSGVQEEVEGCLSCPDDWGVVKRPLKVTVKAQNIKGEEFTITADHLGARALCHEIDHLDGIMIPDKFVRKLTAAEIADMKNQGNK